eukprot:7144664-Alexandrium_andersonii.AAC.1
MKTARTMLLHSALFHAMHVPADSCAGAGLDTPDTPTGNPCMHWRHLSGSSRQGCRPARHES